MDSERFIDMLLFAIPSLITGLIAYYFFKEHTKNEDGRRRFLLKKDLQVSILPNRLQAYERLTLYLERISPNKLLIRLSPNNLSKEDYESLLIQTIEQELEHNLTQQIYVSEKCWNIVLAAKNATIQLIRRRSLSEKITSADKLREAILTEMMEKRAPSDAALSLIKEEIAAIF
jgi:hypothetical protein